MSYNCGCFKTGFNVICISIKLVSTAPYNNVDTLGLVPPMLPFNFAT